MNTYIKIEVAAIYKLWELGGQHLLVVYLV